MSTERFPSATNKLKLKKYGPLKIPKNIKTTPCMPLRAKFNSRGEFIWSGRNEFRTSFFGITQETGLSDTEVNDAWSIIFLPLRLCQRLVILFLLFNLFYSVNLVFQQSCLLCSHLVLKAHLKICDLCPPK